MDSFVDSVDETARDIWLYCGYIMSKNDAWSRVNSGDETMRDIWLYHGYTMSKKMHGLKYEFRK